MAECQKCADAKLSAKAAGFRDWRASFVCYDHAAVDLDAWLAENGYSEDDMPQPDDGQLDLFGEVA